MNQKNKNKPHHQRLKEAEAAMSHHAATVQWYKDQFLNKLVLVGIQGQGTERSFVKGVEGQFLGQIAVKLSQTLDGDSGMYFDVQQLRFYKVYDELETEKFVSEFNKGNQITELKTV